MLVRILHGTASRSAPRNGEQQDFKLASLPTDANHKWLEEIGFARPKDMIDIIDGWMSGVLHKKRASTQLSPEFCQLFLSVQVMQLTRCSFAVLQTSSEFTCRSNFCPFVQHPQLADLVARFGQSPCLDSSAWSETGLFDLLLELSFYPFHLNSSPAWRRRTNN